MIKTAHKQMPLDPSFPSEKQPATLLVVNTGTNKKRFILQRLKELGLHLIFLNSRKNWAKPYASHWILADTYNHAESLSAVEQFIQQNPGTRPDGVITFWEDDVLLASRICDRFGFVGIPYDCALIAKDKYRFRQFCEENGLPAPAHKIINSLSLSKV